MTGAAYRNDCCLPVATDVYRVIVTAAYRMTASVFP